MTALRRIEFKKKSAPIDFHGVQGFFEPLSNQIQAVQLITIDIITFTRLEIFQSRVFLHLELQFCKAGS